MTIETYKFQYEHWHQDTTQSRDTDVASSVEYINVHGIWPANKDAIIFDVGCGMGRFLLAFRKNGYKNLSGIDIDDYQIDIAKKEKLDVKSIGANEFFTKNNKQYDLVTMIDCLEHIEKDKQIDLLTKINNSLSSDGQLFIQVPNALAPAFAYLMYVDFTHRWSYTDRSLAYILKNSGFEYITFRPACYESEHVIRLKTNHAELLKAEFGMDNPILTSNIVAVAFKSKKAFDTYQKTAPKIEIKYKVKRTWRNKLINR